MPLTHGFDAEFNLVSRPRAGDTLGFENGVNLFETFGVIIGVCLDFLVPFLRVLVLFESFARFMHHGLRSVVESVVFGFLGGGRAVAAASTSMSTFGRRARGRRRRRRRRRRRAARMHSFDLDAV